jgi:hypothetical protein
MMPVVNRLPGWTFFTWKYQITASEVIACTMRIAMVPRMASRPYW